MPLYMDFHKIPNITLEEAKKAHTEDERIQQEYGVKYLQFWVNEGAGTLFCLVEGPDKLTCESVHKIAHGHVACAMVEVDPSYYSLIMGENIRVDQGVVHDEEGTVDLGYRTILAASVQRQRSENEDDYEYLKTPVKARERILADVHKFGGRTIELTGEDNLISVFNSATRAVQCAHEIKRNLTLYNTAAMGTETPVVFSIGVAAGQPVTENNEFIENTIRLANRLSAVAGKDEILSTSLVNDLCEGVAGAIPKTKSLNAAEEQFLTDFFGIIEVEIANENFNIESLVRTIGISRPQLYRKVHNLAKKAPNDLIRDLRLEKALSLLKRKTGNISEVALEVGFSNPSYFAKCFTKKFGCSPSRFMTVIGC